jgi:DNA-binding NtrC family response regulator
VNKTVVVIDDEEELRREIAEYLERQGYTVLQCDSSEAARRTVDALVDRAAPGIVVLCDEGLSDGDGLDVFLDCALRLRDSRWFLMSGNHDAARLAEHRRIAGGLPPYTVLEKPFSLRALRLALRDRPD